MQEFVDFVAKGWESACSTLPPFLQSADNKASWFKTEFGNLLSRFTQEPDTNSEPWNKILVWLGSETRSCESLSKVEKFILGRTKELGDDIADELQKAFTLDTATLPAFISKDALRLEWFLSQHENQIEAYISRRKKDLISKRTLWDSVSECLSLNDKFDVNMSEAKSCLELVRESAFPSHTADLDEKFESVWEALNGKVIMVGFNHTSR